MTTVAELIVDPARRPRRATRSGASSATPSTRVTDAIRREDRIEWIGVRHEEVAAFAAGAQAQLTGTLGGVHGHGRPRFDPPAQRPVRREEVARAGARASAARCRWPSSARDFFQEVDNDALFTDVAVFARP